MDLVKKSNKQKLKALEKRIKAKQATQEGYNEDLDKWLLIDREISVLQSKKKALEDRMSDAKQRRGCSITQSTYQILKR